MPESRGLSCPAFQVAAHVAIFSAAFGVPAVYSQAGGQLGGGSCEVGEPSLCCRGGTPGVPESCVWVCVGSHGPFPASSHPQPGAGGCAASCLVLQTAHEARLQPAPLLSQHGVLAGCFTSGMSVPSSGNGGPWGPRAGARRGGLSGGMWSSSGFRAARRDMVLQRMAGCSLRERSDRPFSLQGWGGGGWLL